MNSANTNKKKLSEYQIEDIKEFFGEVFRKISSKVILLEIGNDFINIALAKSQKNKLFITFSLASLIFTSLLIIFFNICLISSLKP